MRLSRIYVDQSLAVGFKVTLDVASSHYVRHVLRLKPDSPCLLFNADEACDYLSRLTFEGKQTKAQIESRLDSTRECSLDSEILLGLSRSDHIDFSIQKCTELGVSRISIFNAQHSQISLKTNQAEKRLSHWQAIAIKACEQCGRHRPPVIEFFNKIETALDRSGGRKNKLLLNIDGPSLPELLFETKKQTQISLLIGPEGGLSAKETDRAEQQGFVSAKLGPRVLRTETAAMAALAIVQSIWGDLIG